MTIPNLLKEFRTTYDLSQQQLADWINQALEGNGIETHYSKMTISNWESGRKSHLPGRLIVDVLASSAMTSNDLPLYNLFKAIKEAQK